MCCMSRSADVVGRRDRQRMEKVTEVTGTRSAEGISVADECGIFPPVFSQDAAMLLRELGWGSQFVGAEMSPGAGNSAVYLYSLTEAERYLRRGMAGAGLTTGGVGTLIWLDFAAFTDWIGREIGDAPLADAIRRRIALEHTLFEKVRVASHLLSARHAQLLESRNMTRGDSDHDGR